MSYKTEQDALGAGQFEEDYIARNQGSVFLSAGVGMNLKAFRLRLIDVDLDGVETHSSAATALRNPVGDPVERLDRYPNLVLRDYDFGYQKDPQCSQDDVRWFELETPSAIQSKK